MNYEPYNNPHFYVDVSWDSFSLGGVRGGMQLSLAYKRNGVHGTVQVWEVPQVNDQRPSSQEVHCLHIWW